MRVQCIQLRERQLESPRASSVAVINRLSLTPLLWVQWLRGKSVQLVIKRSLLDSQLDPCGFSFSFSLSKA